MKRRLGLFALLLLAACSTAPQNPDDEFAARDPWESINRPIFDFNVEADRYVIRPVSQGYHYLPDVVRYGIGNFLTNLTEPQNTLNSFLQLDFQAGGTSLFRFILNSTFGLGGLRDFAGENGLKYNDQGFSKTLGRYGVDTGPYVVVPLAGPSDVRGTVGYVVDWFTDPMDFVLTTPESIAEMGVSAIAERDDDKDVIDQFYYESLEPYSASRAAYLQHQAFQ